MQDPIVFLLEPHFRCAKKSISLTSCLWVPLRTTPPRFDCPWQRMAVTSLVVGQDEVG